MKIATVIGALGIALALGTLARAADVDLQGFQCLKLGGQKVAAKAVVVASVTDLAHRNADGSHRFSSKGYVGTDVLLEHPRIIWRSRAGEKDGGFQRLNLLCPQLNQGEKCPGAFDALPTLPEKKKVYAFYLSREKQVWDVEGFTELKDGSEAAIEQWALTVLQRLDWNGCQ